MTAPVKPKATQGHAIENMGLAPYLRVDDEGDEKDEAGEYRGVVIEGGEKHQAPPKMAARNCVTVAVSLMPCSAE